LLAFILKFQKNIVNTVLNVTLGIPSSSTILITKFLKNSKAKVVLFWGLLIFQFVIMHDYVTIRAIKLAPFIDEYIALTSNVAFYKNLNFTAGEFIGGNYSIYLTSGPISSLGSVIGWNVSNNIITTRISNYYWIVCIQIILIFLIKKSRKNIKFLILISVFYIPLIPWWIGLMYSIGEVASTLIFVNSIFLLKTNEKLSFFLMGLSIIFGKLLTVIPFVGFFIFYSRSNKKIKESLKLLTYFSIPFGAWFLLVSLNYEDGNLFDYLLRQFDLIANHQSSGVQEISFLSMENFRDTLLTSEYSTWNVYDKTRILIVPLLFSFLIYKNRLEINRVFGEIAMPIIGSVSLTYIWFWLMSPTKWMRYSQHFTIIIIFSLIYIFNSKLFHSNLDFLIALMLFSIFIEDEKFLIIATFFISVILLVQKNPETRVIFGKIALIIILFLNLTISYFRTGNSTYDTIPSIESCIETLLDNKCKEEFILGEW